MIHVIIDRVTAQQTNEMKEELKTYIKLAVDGRCHQRRASSSHACTENSWSLIEDNFCSMTDDKDTPPINSLIQPIPQGGFEKRKRDPEVIRQWKKQRILLCCLVVGIILLSFIAIKGVLSALISGALLIWFLVLVFLNGKCPACKGWIFWRNWYPNFCRHCGAPGINPGGGLLCPACGRSPEMRLYSFCQKCGEPLR